MGADFDASMAFRFLLNSSRWYNLNIWWFLFLKKLLSKYLTAHEILQKTRIKARYPNRFLVFTKAAAQIFVERDGINENQLEELGFPEFDDFFKNMANKPNEKYFLLIDFPLSPIDEYKTNGYGFTHQEVLEYHKKIADYAKSQSAVLYVKLHPYQYPIALFEDMDNIRYFREANNHQLIGEAYQIYGFSSTLMLPAIYAKKVGLFQFLKSSDFLKKLEQYQITKNIPFPNFKPADLDLDNLQVAKENHQKFVQEYLKFADGNALKRLRDKLLEV